ncbi:MAG: hypothetical protein QM582_00630 [Micropruina sp.]|uniref:hypothetical protein n=1 Tax=Micropruina sp. TaxID=2737536 RepID=UPI0039E3F9A0
MANWTDGPEYAPLDRPAAFQSPAAAPLEVPVAVPNPAAGAPSEHPGWQPPQAAGVPLEALVPAAGVPPRDPRTEFTTVSSVMSAGSVWGTASTPSGQPAWTPDQPLTVSTPVAATPPAPMAPMPPALDFPPPQQPAPPFPQPGTPDWFAPPPQTHWNPPSQTVSVAQMWNAATPGTIIPLLIGMLINPLSLAMVIVSAVLAGRVRYRRDQVRRSYLWAGAMLAVIAALSLINSDFDLETAWGVVSGWAQLACWILPVVVLLQVGAGIRANEPPQRPY